MRNIKTTLVLHQIIGFIRITSKDKRIDFNSDRSQFLQNEVTDSIKKFLYDINRKIQETGSTHKKYLMDFDFLTTRKIPNDYINSNAPNAYRELIKSDFAFKNKVAIKVHDNKVIYSLFGKMAILNIQDVNSSSGTSPESKGDPVPAVINLNCPNEQEIQIPSTQIDLKDYIVSVFNSDKEQVRNNEVRIQVDGKDLPTGILPSVEKPCAKTIEYCYLDSKTGMSLVRIKLVFIEPKSNINTPKPSDLLIYIPARQGYSINYNQFLDKLIEQIKNLKTDKYLEIISCSLRPIFELSVGSIYKSQKYHGKFNRALELAEGVCEIITYIKSNKRNIGEIDKTTIIGYHNLNNLLNADEFKKAVKNAHLGSHHTSTLITEPEIKHIAKYASLFIVITNEMINNSNIH
jgi:hypothetical protein